MTPVPRVVVALLAAILLLVYVGFTELRLYHMWIVNWQAIARINETEKRMLDLEREIARWEP